MIGVAGCGRMGAPMLDALLEGGVKATGFDVIDKNVAHITTDSRSFAVRLETLFSVVRDAHQTDALLFDDQDLIAAAPHLSRVFICSTVSPRYIETLRQRMPDHIALIDAPMSGAQVGAIDRTLSFMLGGNDQDIRDAIPLLALMGQHFHHMGPLGSGMQAKVLNNLLAASHTAMTRLVLDWADVAGLDHGKLLNLIETSSGQNWLASGFDTIEFAKHGHERDNSIGIIAKDVVAALDAAPPHADTRLPELLKSALESLKPYI